MTAMNSVFQKTFARSHEWLSEMMTHLDIDDERRALRALRAGLHVIRDHLPSAEAVDLAAQLPMLLRGLYYEGWRPTDRPERVHDQDELLALVKDELEGDPALDPEAVLRAVIRVLGWHVSGGELDDVARTLPRALAEIWEDTLA